MRDATPDVPRKHMKKSLNNPEHEEDDQEDRQGRYEGEEDGEPTDNPFDHTGLTADEGDDGEAGEDY
jgi:hypothetical protein